MLHRAKDFAAIVFLVSALVCFVSGWADRLLLWRMRSKINSILPPEDRISHFIWWFGKNKAVTETYRRLFPEGRSSEWRDITMVFEIASFALLVLAFLGMKR